MQRSTPVIRVGDLGKTFRVPEREASLRAAARSLVRRRDREVRAVDGITFEVGAGEVVVFLGPNGAGKTTTLKMLSGLLYPTSGTASVLGHVPWRREKNYLRQITLIGPRPRRHVPAERWCPPRRGHLHRPDPRDGQVAVDSGPTPLLGRVCLKTEDGSMVGGGGIPRPP